MNKGMAANQAPTPGHQHDGPRTGWVVERGVLGQDAALGRRLNQLL